MVGQSENDTQDFGQKRTNRLDVLSLDADFAECLQNAGGSIMTDTVAQ